MSDDRGLRDRVGAKVEQAQTYFEDGALLCAALCLREAAEMLEIAAAERHEALSRSMAEAS